VPVISASYQIDRHLHVLPASFAIEEFGDLTFTDLLSGNTELALKMIYYPELPAWTFDNDWHNAIMMAYADDYRPDTLTGPCTVAGLDCLVINNAGGILNDKVSLLVIAGQHDWDDVDTNGFFDDPQSVFDTENNDLDSDFDAHADSGNDKILVIDEL
jgi:hypothetical protein